jgi:predicted nucleic acid-binding protein
VFKLTHDERESLALVAFIEDNAIEASTSVLAEVEVVRNLHNRRLDSDQAMTGFYLIALDEDVRRLATGFAGTLRSLDAIHVASALAIGDREVQFITYDDRQADVARECGLIVVQPGR